MRFKKTIVFSIIILTIFLTYLFFHDTKLNYVVLGDSLAAGVNPYGEIGYGYSDYIRDYLKKQNRLKQYVKEYAVSGYTTEDVLADLENNKKVMVNNHEVNLRNILRESDLVTISIGANDFMRGLNVQNLNFKDINPYLRKIDKIMNNVNTTLLEVRKYAKNDIILIGYYNPFPILFSSYEKEVDEMFRYVDKAYEKACSKYNVQYISIYQLFKENSSFLPNPFDIHPNLKGYSAISNFVIESVLNK